LTQYIPGESVLDLFSRTDTAMYLAKRGGRNQVVVEEPSAELWQAVDA
jgi:PleD family two-component response regulator